MQAWQIPYSIRVESVTNFQHSWADGDGLVVEDLVKNAMSLPDLYLEQKKKVALSEPLLVNRLISPSAHVTGINVTINLPGKTITEVPEVAAFVRNMADDFRSNHPEFNVYLTGVAMINNQFVEAGQQDMQTLVPIMFLLIAVGLWVALRSLAGTMSTLLLIGMATATALGIGGWWGVLLTPVSANAPVYILTMAVADAIHILITLFHEMRHGKTKNQAIVESLRVNFKPVFITSVTTAIGFCVHSTVSPNRRSSRRRPLSGAGVVGVFCTIGRPHLRLAIEPMAYPL